jgi:hypothetical protein
LPWIDEGQNHYVVKSLGLKEVLFKGKTLLIIGVLIAAAILLFLLTA